MLKGVFGIISKSGTIGHNDTFIKAHQSLSTNNEDSCFHYFHENVLLGIVTNSCNNDNIYEKQPQQTDKDIIVFTGRLDNRAELYDLLDISESDLFTDTTIVSMIYQKYRFEAFDKLLGDWQMATFNTQTREVLIARDHHGISSLYYTVTKESLVFSYSLRTLLAYMSSKPSLNHYKIAQHLIGWNDHDEATIFNEIKRLPPAHVFHVKNGGYKKVNYWDLGGVKEIRYTNEEDYVSHFEELFTECIKCRIRGSEKVGIMLSSGLDSISIATLLSNELKKENKVLHAYVNVPKYENYVIPDRFTGNELSYVREFVDLFPNIELHQIENRNFDPLDGIEFSLKTNVDPVFSVSNAYWIFEILSICSQADISKIFTGQGGNATISWPIKSYVEDVHFSRGKIVFKKALFNKHYFKKYIINSLSSIFYNEGARIASSRIKDSVITPELANETSIQVKFKDWMNEQINNKLNSKFVRYSIIKPGKSKLGSIWHECGMAYNCEVLDPTMDKRIIEYCFSIPDDQFIINGMDRMLVRRMLQRKVPEQIIWRQKKGFQSADLILQLMIINDKLQQSFNILKSDNRICYFVNMEKVNFYLNKLNNGLLSIHDSLKLLRIFNCCYFLNNYL